MGYFSLHSLISFYNVIPEKPVKSMTFAFLFISSYIALYRHFVEFYNNFTTQLHFFRTELAIMYPVEFVSDLDFLGSANAK